jgi:FG-GAP-like repeat
VDIDGDGHRDILSGSYSRLETDMAGLFQVLRGKPDGTFRRAEVLKGTDGEPLIIPIKGRQELTEKICTRPFAVDWDGDGQLDLVVGNFAGTFYWFKGQGKGKFPPRPEPIQAGGSPLRIAGAHSDPFVIDWDGDGDFDVLSGSSNGGVQWAENRAGKGKTPDLTRFRPLIQPGAPVEYGQPVSEDDLTGPTRATRVWVDDVNSDGKLDLLVGDSVTLISPVEGLSAVEFKKKFADWQDAFKAAAEALGSVAGDAKDRTKANEDYRAVYNRRSEFMHEERTGFVWLYLQK